MIEYINQNVTDVTKGIIAHGVNCQRKMGSGVAKAIRAKWPIVYERYMEYDFSEHALGLTHIIAIDDQLWVANCYTQQYYGYDKKQQYASMDAVKKTLADVFCYASNMQVPVYLPKIGCGRGGLNWEAQVEPCINALSKEYKQPTYVCIWRDEYDT